MFRLSELEALPSRCIDLKDDVPLCVSCMFGIERRRQRRKKCKIPGYISKEIENKPGAIVSVYQLQSAHTRLVPQFSGKLTGEQIWDAQVIVENFIDLNHVHLIRSTRQEETLEVKPSFEIWSDTFAVKTKIYHADNGIFSEQPFISAIEGKK